MLAPASAMAAGTVVLREDFNGNQVDTATWSVGTWKLGRTQLGNVPVVAGGMAQLSFNTYRFTGSEIYTKTNFTLGNGMEFEARVRSNQLPSGLVTSLFTYNTQNSLADELDIEFLSKQVNLSSTGAPMLMTTWNDWNEASPTYGDGVHHSSQSKPIVGLAQPDLATPLRINFWAPASIWTEAYDSRLKPVNSKRQGRVYYYDVDWVEVRQLP